MWKVWIRRTRALTTVARMATSRATAPMSLLRVPNPGITTTFSMGTAKQKSQRAA